MCCTDKSGYVITYIDHFVAVKTYGKQGGNSTHRFFMLGTMTDVCVLLVIFLFFLVLLPFRRDEAIHREEERSEDMETMDGVTGSCAFDRGKSHIL